MIKKELFLKPNHIVAWITIWFFISILRNKIIIINEWKEKNEYANYSYKNNKHPQLGEVYNDLFNTDLKTIVITGEHGTGKSILLRDIAQKLLNEKYVNNDDKEAKDHLKCKRNQVITIKTWDYDDQIKNPLKILILKILEAKILERRCNKKLKLCLKLFNSKKLQYNYGVDHVRFTKKCTQEC